MPRLGSGLLLFGGFSLLGLAPTAHGAPATFANTGNLATARYLHSATLLSNGKVLVAGGFNANRLASAELYDPATGAWSATGSMAATRHSHTATLLPNGKVLVVGGSATSGSLASAELYDPATGVWSATGSMAGVRREHTATLLPNGKVLVAGGFTTTSLPSAELYDPATGVWSATGSLATARYDHSATLLPNGKVLVAGGEGASIFASAELYDPSTGAWSATASMAAARYDHSATLLPNGKVLVAAGYYNGILASAELYDSATGAWSATGSLAAVRRRHSATLLPNGKVLVAGGQGAGGSYLTSAELYDPATGAWNATGSMAGARVDHSATLLPNGKVLVAGGFSGGTTTLANSELYEPTRGKSINISTRLDVQTGENVLVGGFIITGTGGKSVVIRGIGPSLAAAGVQGALQDPIIELHYPSGFVNTNDNWKDTQAAQIQATSLAPTDDRESAFTYNLAPGNYTVVLKGKNNTTGIGLIEVYDIDQLSGELANISTRGQVGAGDNVMIGGFILGGNGSRVLVRAIGPSLASFGINNALADPRLSMRNANGTQAVSNDDWNHAQGDEIRATGLAPSDERESAIVITLPNGNYTAIVEGYNGGTGVGLIEVYNLR